MGLYKRGTVWWYEFQYDYRRYRGPGGTTKKQAEYVQAKCKADVREGRYFDVAKTSAVTFDDMVTEYLKWTEINKRSARRDTISAGHLTRALGGRRISHITPKDIEDYKRTRVSRVSGATVNRELACLKHMFNLAIKWGMATKNPVIQVKFFREPRGRLRVLTQGEEERLVAAACAHLKSIIVTALNTGMRRGEILNLTWQDVDFGQNVLTIRHSKSGEMRQIPMNQRMVRLLGSMAERKRGQFVFCHRDGRPYVDIKGSFNAAVKRAGLPYCRMHDCRHTFASRLVMNGVDIVTVKELLGHKTLAMTMRYSHPAPEHKRWAIEVLNLEDGTHKSPHSASLEHNEAPTTNTTSHARAKR